jgi:hypothetical protein
LIRPSHRHGRGTSRPFGARTPYHLKRYDNGASRVNAAVRFIIPLAPTDKGMMKGARPGRSGRAGIVGHTALPTGEWSFRRLLEKRPAGLMTYDTLQAVQPWGRTPPLNDPVDRFCDPFTRLPADDALIAHDYGSMA